MAGNRIELKELVGLDMGVPGSDWKKAECLIEAVCCPDEPYGKEFVALDPSTKAELMNSFHFLFFRRDEYYRPPTPLSFSFGTLTRRHPTNQLLQVYANIAATYTQRYEFSDGIQSINQPDLIALGCACMAQLVDHVQGRMGSTGFWPDVMANAKLGHLLFAASKYEAACQAFSISLGYFPVLKTFETSEFYWPCAQAKVTFGNLFEKKATEHFLASEFAQAYAQYQRACKLSDKVQMPRAKLGRLLAAGMLPDHAGISLEHVIDSLLSVTSASLDMVVKHEGPLVSMLLPMLTISGDAANTTTDLLKFKAWVSAVNSPCSLSAIIFARQMDKVHSNIEKMLLTHPEEASAYLGISEDAPVATRVYSVTRAYAAVAIKDGGGSRNRFALAMSAVGPRGLAEFGASLQDPGLKRRYFELCCHYYGPNPPRSEQQYAEAINAERQMIELEDQAGNSVFSAVRYNHIADYYYALSRLSGNHQYDEAYEAISKAIERETNPDNKARYHLKRARWYRELGKEQLARADVIAVRQLVPAAANLVDGFLLESDAEQFRDEVNVLWIKVGNDYLDANKLEEARSEFTQALSLSPENKIAMDALLFIELRLHPENSPCSEDFLLRLVNARANRTSVFFTLRSRLNILQRENFAIKIQRQLFNVLRYEKTDGLRQRMLKMSGIMKASGVMKAIDGKFSLLRCIAIMSIFPFEPILYEKGRQISGELPHTDLMKAICAQIDYDDNEYPPRTEYLPDKKKILPEGSTSHSISHSFTVERSMSANTTNPNDYSKLAGFYLQESRISEAIDAISQGLALPLPSAEVTYYNLYIQLSHLAPLMLPQTVQDMLSRASGGFDGALEELRVRDTPEANLARNRLLAVVGRKATVPVELERLPKANFVGPKLNELSKISLFTVDIFALFNSNQIPLVKSLDEIVPAVLLEEFLRKIVKLRLSKETADFYNAYKPEPNYIGALKDALCNMAMPHSSCNRETLALQQELALLIIWDDRSFPGATARITRGVPIIGMTERMKKLLEKWNDFIAACPDKDIKIMLHMQRAIFFCDHQMWLEAFVALDKAKFADAENAAHAETMERHQAYCVKEMSFLTRSSGVYTVPKNRPPLKPCMPMSPTSSSAAAAAAAASVTTAASAGVAAAAAAAYRTLTHFSASSRDSSVEPSSAAVAAGASVAHGAGPNAHAQSDVQKREEFGL